MSSLPLHVTEEQIAAAQLRIVLDEKLGRHTPNVVRRIALMTGVDSLEDTLTFSPASSPSDDLTSTEPQTDRDPGVSPQIGHVERTAPPSDEPGAESSGPAVADLAEDPRLTVNPGYGVREPAEIRLDLAELRTMLPKLMSNREHRVLLTRLHRLSAELRHDHP
jgi:hypothetical protein